MAGKLMAGFWRHMFSVPPFLWQKQFAKARMKAERNLGFMTAEHRAVHHFIVRELPRVGKPISVEFAAENLSVPRERMRVIFEDLEEHMTFICRNNSGEAAWAYPVTVEKTPHSLVFSTGEKIYAA